MFFYVVVLVAGDDVENHAAKLLFDLLRRQLQLAHNEERLLIAMCVGVVEIEIRHRAERGHVLPAALRSKRRVIK